MTPVKPTGKQPGKQPNGVTPAGPSANAASLDQSALNSLPMLTEVVADLEKNPSRALNEPETQQLLRQIESRIEILFTQKLGLQLEQLQRQAIDRALGELRAELPELLRDAMNAYLDSR